jgi:hypothetical protein
MQPAGVLDAISSKIVHGENVQQALPCHSRGTQMPRSWRFRSPSSFPALAAPARIARPHRSGDGRVLGRAVDSVSGVADRLVLYAVKLASAGHRR